LAEIQGDIAEAKAFINLMGWELPPGVEDIGLATLDLGDFLEKLDAVIGTSAEEWEDEIAMLGRIAELTLAVNTLVQAIRVLAEELPTKLAAFGDYVDRTNIHKELPRRLFDFLLINYLARKSPLSFAILHLINVFDYPHFDADPTNFQVEHVRATVNYHLFKTLVTDPAQLAKEAYGWNTPQFAVMTLLQRVSLLFQTLGLRSRVQPLHRQAEESWLERTVVETEPMPQLITFVHEERGNIAGLRLGFSIFGARPTSEGASDGGLGLVPIVRGQVEGEIPLPVFEDTVFEFLAQADVLKRIALILRPNLPPQVRTASSLGELATGRFALGIRHGRAEGEPKTLVNFPGGSGFSLRQFTLHGGLDKTSETASESFVELGLLGCEMTVSLSEADGFLSRTMARDRLEAPFDVHLGWSSSNGIYFRGGTGLDITVPLHAALGPISLESLHLALDIRDDGFDVEASTSGALSLGPLAVTIDRLGLLVHASFNGGNLGLFGLSPRFKPPNGIGLAIDAQAVVGGGDLAFDAQQAEYSGILELQIAERIAVKAIGVLSTRLPDGEGYSLLILITAGRFPPIQLGLGFALTAMGGLLAINRTFAEEALRAGLKNHTLDSVLFPQDPLRNAPQLLSNLNQVFPPADGHHLFGPMVQIAWGTPPLITADLGLVLEFGARRRLLVLGQVLAILPRREHELLRLQLDAVGVLDFDQGTAALDATLYDSRLLQRFPLTGDMAMRLQWEGVEWPTLALAVGGLHPAFTPPPKFPKLERIAINLSAGDNPRLRCEAYFALTSNTVQFGARAELYAAAIGFSLHGEIGFDVLLQLDPFHFLADFYAQVQLKRGPTNLFKVRVEGTLEGPRPLHLKGKATFEILWWDVTIPFNATLVPGATPPLPAPIDVLPLFRDALGRPGNWRSQLPAGQRPLVTLRATPGAATDVRLHPLGTLTVTQSVVPLNLEISRFGSAVPAGERRFTLSVSVGAQSLTTRPVSDFFARAQFVEMSDDEKLSSPSFELLEAGVSLGADAYVIPEQPDDWLAVGTIDYDTILVGPEPDDPRRRAPPEPYALSPVRLGQQARFGAAGSSALRRTGRAKYRTTRGGKYKLVPAEWSIVAAADLSPQPAPGIAAGTPVTYAEAVQALRHLQQEDPAQAVGLKILRRSEVPLAERR
jgi:hypothetical protein